MSAGLSTSEIRYLVIRHLPSAEVNPLIKYPRHPIYGRFRVINPTAAKIDEPFSAGWERIDEKEYWYPFSNAPKFVTEYKAGDEYTVQTQKFIQTAVTAKRGPIYTYSQLNDPLGLKFNKVTNFRPVNTYVEAYGNASYRATDQFVLWSLLGENRKSPYGNYVQVWQRYDPIMSKSFSSNAFYWFDTEAAGGIGLFRLIPSGLVFGPLPNEQFVEFSSLLDGKDRYLIDQGLNVPPRGDTPADVVGGGTTAAGGTGGGGGRIGGTAGGAGNTTNVAARTDNGTQATGARATIATTVRVRGNFGLISPGEQPSSEPQMVQYYKRGSSAIQEPDRHIFAPKPNQINYENLGSEWTEIERVGRIPLVDWKNFRLMKISFQFLVVPTQTYRLGAFGQTADEQITLSIDDQLERLRNMASRPYPVILYGFDDLLTNSSPFVMSSGAGVQFVITDFRISSLLRTPEGAINRATCDISMQEVPIEYINIVSFPKLVPGRVIPGRKGGEDEEYGSQQELATTEFVEF